MNSCLTAYDRVKTIKPLTLWLIYWILSISLFNYSIWALC